MTFWGPNFWDAFALTISPYLDEFLVPMHKGFKRKGLTVDRAVGQKLMKFTVWHFYVDPAVAR
jgi:hypothetical protein